MKKKGILSIIAIVLIVYFFSFQLRWHLCRNEHNKLPIGNLKYITLNQYIDEDGLVWELQTMEKSIFHQPDTILKKVFNAYPIIENPPEFDTCYPNLKFLHKNGITSFEAVLQPNGKYLMDGPKQGTFNYSDPSSIFGVVRHWLLDVIPHIFNSNYDKSCNKNQIGK